MIRVHRVTRGGKVYRYHRKTRAALPDLPEDHPDFIAAWQAEEAKAPKRATRATPGTVEAACKAYLASRSFSDLRASYAAVIRRHVEAIARQGRKAMLADLRRRHIEADLEPLSPAVARSRLKAWRKLAEYWRVSGARADNVAASVKAKRMPATDGHIEWTAEDVEKFRARWPIGTTERLALELLQWTGARASDVVRLGPQMIGADGLLRYRQIKTGGEAFVPWRVPTNGLDHERADLIRCTSDCADLVFLRTVHGKARSHKAFSGWFAAAARAAGLTDRSAHGLRKYRMNRLAEAGAPILAMQAWVGHATLKEVEHYTRRAARAKVLLVNPGRAGCKTLREAE